jgi:phosphopentomutase
MFEQLEAHRLAQLTGMEAEQALRREVVMQAQQAQATSVLNDISVTAVEKDQRRALLLQALSDAKDVDVAIAAPDAVVALQQLQQQQEIERQELEEHQAEEARVLAVKAAEDEAAMLAAIAEEAAKARVAAAADKRAEIARRMEALSVDNTDASREMVLRLRAEMENEVAAYADRVAG